MQALGNAAAVARTDCFRNNVRASHQARVEETMKSEKRSEKSARRKDKVYLVPRGETALREYEKEIATRPRVASVLQRAGRVVRIDQGDAVGHLAVPLAEARLIENGLDPICAQDCAECGATALMDQLKNKCPS